jgi:hypothetical protein
MDFDLDQLADDTAAAAIARDISQTYCPGEEPVELRERRIAEHQAREEHARARRDADRARYEFERAREMERQNQANRAAAQAELKVKNELRQRERDLQHDRDWLAVLEAQQQAEQARQAQAARAQALADHWAQLDAMAANLGRMLAPPPRDPTAERVAALEAELEHQAQEQAFQAERRRSERYLADQRAAVARREERGWG